MPALKFGHRCIGGRRTPAPSYTLCPEKRIKPRFWKDLGNDKGIGHKEQTSPLIFEKVHPNLSDKLRDGYISWGEWANPSSRDLGECSRLGISVAFFPSKSPVRSTEYPASAISTPLSFSNDHPSPGAIQAARIFEKRSWCTPHLQRCPRPISAKDGPFELSVWESVKAPAKLSLGNVRTGGRK